MPFDSENFPARKDAVVFAPAIAPAPILPAMPEGHRRLLVLAEFLETKVPAEQLVMAGWAQGPDFVECGTAACACGWATTIPEFKALGLRLVARGDTDADIWFGEHNDGWDSIRAFFDLADDEAVSTHLFDGDRYSAAPLPHEVAARIRTFVAEQSSLHASVGD